MKKKSTIYLLMQFNCNSTYWVLTTTICKVSNLGIKEWQLSSLSDRPSKHSVKWLNSDPVTSRKRLNKHRGNKVSSSDRKCVLQNIIHLQDTMTLKLWKEDSFHMVVLWWVLIYMYITHCKESGYLFMIMHDRGIIIGNSKINGFSNILELKVTHCSCSNVVK